MKSTVLLLVPAILFGCTSTQPPTEVDHQAQAKLLHLATQVATVKYFEKNWPEKKEQAVKLKNELLTNIYDPNYVPTPNKVPPILNSNEIKLTGIFVLGVKQAIERTSLNEVDKELAKSLIDVVAPYIDKAIQEQGREVPSYYLDYLREAVSGITAGVAVLERQ